MTSTSTIQSALSVGENARRILRLIGARPQHSAETLPPSFSLRAYSLQPPEPIITSLVNQGLRPPTAEAFSQLFMRHALELKTRFDINLNNAIRKAMQRGAEYGVGDCFEQHSEVITSYYQSHYNRILEELLASSVQRLQQQIETLRKQCYTPVTVQGKKPTFNPRVLDVLEQSFLENRYPSKSEKERLAHLTKMEYKQINVWFQNHRTRCKKDGDAKRRVFCYAPYTLPKAAGFSSLLRSTSPPQSDFISENSLTQETDQPSSPSSVVYNSPCDPCTSNTSCTSVLNAPSPPHAYPSPYPPSCDYDPFPISSTRAHFPAPWPRNATSKPPQSLENGVSLEDLSLSLRRLDLSSDSQELDGSGVLLCENKDNIRSALACGLVTILPHAPLMSLIRTQKEPLSSFAHRTSVSDPHTPSHHTHSLSVRRRNDTLAFSLEPIRDLRASPMKALARTRPKGSRNSMHPYFSQRRRHSRPRRSDSPNPSISSGSEDSRSSSTSASTLPNTPLCTPPTSHSHLYPSWVGMPTNLEKSPFDCCPSQALQVCPKTVTFSNSYG